ncbi:hypothetical protein P8S54_07680 [Thiomicrospira sp. R3]|uniref:hypothetical protein n=1 Tax=Thiomicrospira sp. R3 TaxID=3035472 RepID=UPI00259B88CE|nr:hypothetical protein [Thiomicrospira sp. R3]WFE68102.1 hypothetical protein P8S54_07680 [Thiomicrospira sp. R3]
MKLLTLIAKATAILVAGLVAIWFFFDYLLLAILSVIAILYVIFYDGRRSKSATNNSAYEYERDLERHIQYRALSGDKSQYDFENRCRYTSGRYS